MAKKKVLYIHPFLATFVKKDISYLSEKFDLSIYEFNPKKKWQVPFLLTIQFFTLLFKAPRASLLVIQFGGYHSFLPCLFGKIYRKPTLVVLGGTDCVSFPSINYGNFNKNILGWFTKKTYQYATHLSPVHETLVYTPYTYQNNDYPFQGYKYFCPNINTPYTVIHNGFDSTKFYRKSHSSPLKSFISIAFLNNNRNTLKGVDLIIEVAKKLPDCKFTLIGNNPNQELLELPENIILKPYVPNEKLADEYSNHTFYLQLSINEGFPNALCEAMLCGCIPICSGVGSMEYIVGNSGFILQKKDVTQLEELIKKAVASDTNTLSKKARSRIEDNFTEGMRKDKLLALTTEMCKKNNLNAHHF